MTGIGHGLGLTGKAEVAQIRDESQRAYVWGSNRIARTELGHNDIPECRQDEPDTPLMNQGAATRTQALRTARQH